MSSLRQFRLRKRDDFRYVVISSLGFENNSQNNNRCLIVTFKVTKMKKKLSRNTHCFSLQIEPYRENYE